MNKMRINLWSMFLFQIDWMKAGGYGGFMVWAYDLDDFNGLYCGGTRYPLIQTMNSALSDGNIPPVTTLSTPEPT